MINVGERPLSLNDFSEILFKGKQVGLDAAAIAKVEENHRFLQNFSTNKLIYGINTGFWSDGPV